jgi:hypothetical protein
MALKKTVTTVHGFEAVDAYHRVEQVHLAHKDKIQFSVRVYKSDEPGFVAFADSQHSCAYGIEGANPIQQAYEYIKTLPEYANAQDC